MTIATVSGFQGTTTLVSDRYSAWKTKRVSESGQKPSDFPFRKFEPNARLDSGEIPQAGRLSSEPEQAG
jgi:hypothetical protein